MHQQNRDHFGNSPGPRQAKICDKLGWIRII
jgi:hypothetical protein